MKLAIIPLLALATDVVLGLPQSCSGPGADRLTVQTSTGSFTGLIDPAYPSTRQWRAIPFAKPPVASRRWLPPQKLSSPPSDHHWATRFPPSCPQYVSSLPSIWQQNFTKGNLIDNGGQNDTSGLSGENTSEDCLYLAVWSPANATTTAAAAKLPVLVFMPGGGFQQGGVSVPWYQPTSWVERSQSHIVVTLNYRLNIFGFPNARGLNGSDASQNLGILDQRAALEWLRDNIAAFGGDAKRIILWGQSAGSMSADFHAFAFRDDPIAQAYFMQSGDVFNPRLGPWDQTFSNFSFVARQVGCAFDDDADGAAELDCMRRVSYPQIMDMMVRYNDAGTTPPLSFVPIRDDRIVFTNYTARSEAGLLARAPYIISNTANEAAALSAWPASNYTVGPWQPAITARDVSFSVCGTYNSTVYRNRLGNDVPVFRYQYAGTFPNSAPYKWLGAYHSSDLPMIFGRYELMDVQANSTEFQAEVSLVMEDHILAFVKDPFHGPQTLGWKPMLASDPHGGSLIRFGANAKAVQQIDGVEVNGVCQGIGEYNPFP